MEAGADLHSAALARAHTLRDRRVAEVLSQSLFTVRAAADTWESSDGTVHTVDVVVRVDGHGLGLCAASPSVRDAVVETITSVAPSTLHRSVARIELCWGLRERKPEVGYRETPLLVVDERDSAAFAEALVGYLRASGAENIALAIDESSEYDAGSRTLHLPAVGRELHAPIRTAAEALTRHPIRMRTR